ncbi:MAG: histidine kinase [Spirochaetes bacterium GWD1_27_9]|nr:MAG: histidine kinase [Spirochaetes bacterium GWB1_27_13]OHD24336.1 MAG: histidine kinase [Spirochaetes bacterium GWC1_27_15]OHD36157.1 MAG: histidine kinase [Spirochaetes bacterium GWD1_27_9]
MTFFIVDDSAVLRTIVKSTLLSYGYKDTIEAEDGEDALKKFNTLNKKVSLFILDVNMPNLNGLELLEEIRKKDSKTPIIMLTTESDKEKMILAKELGATGWIIKPFDKEKFIKIIEMLIKK